MTTQINTLPFSDVYMHTPEAGECPTQLNKKNHPTQSYLERESLTSKRGWQEDIQHVLSLLPVDPAMTLSLNIVYFGPLASL